MHLPDELLAKIFGSFDRDGSEVASLFFTCLRFKDVLEQLLFKYDHNSFFFSKTTLKKPLSRSPAEIDSLLYKSRRRFWKIHISAEMSPETFQALATYYRTHKIKSVVIYCNAKVCTLPKLYEILCVVKEAEILEIQLWKADCCSSYEHSLGSSMAYRYTQRNPAKIEFNNLKELSIDSRYRDQKLVSDTLVSLLLFPKLERFSFTDVRIRSSKAYRMLQYLKAVKNININERPLDRYSNICIHLSEISIGISHCSQGIEYIEECLTDRYVYSLKLLENKSLIHKCHNILKMVEKTVVVFETDLNIVGKMSNQLKFTSVYRLVVCNGSIAHNIDHVALRFPNLQEIHFWSQRTPLVSNSTYNLMFSRLPSLKEITGFYRRTN